MIGVIFASIIFKTLQFDPSLGFRISAFITYVILQVFYSYQRRNIWDLKSFEVDSLSGFKPTDDQFRIYIDFVSGILVYTALK